MDTQPSPANANKTLPIIAIAVIGALAFWQLARSGFDWRTAVETSDPWFFFLAMASLPVFGFPISACYIFAGLAFPPATAIACCLGALAVNMSASYILTATVFKGPVERFVAARQWKIPGLGTENHHRLTFLVRTVPGPPFFFQNLILALAGIPFFTYLWISLATQGSIGIVMILCTRYLSNDPMSMGGIIAITLISILIIAKTVQSIRKRHLKKKNKEA